MDLYFGHWFMGLIDGEGCFVITRHRNKNFYCKFYLKLRNDDYEIINKIQKEINIGKIRYTKRFCRLEIETKKDSLILCEIINFFGLRSKKKCDYNIWKNAVDYWNHSYVISNKNRHHDMMNYKKDISNIKLYNNNRTFDINNNDQHFIDWLSGFIDGEGRFSIEKTNFNNFCCNFSIGQRNDDGGLFKIIHEFLGMGKLINRNGHNYKQHLLGLENNMIVKKYLNYFQVN